MQFVDYTKECNEPLYNEGNILRIVAQFQRFEKATKGL